MTIQGINKKVDMEVAANAKKDMHLENVIEDTNSVEYKKRKREFDRVMKNCQVVGNKKFSYVPVELLFADKRFQRVDTSSKAKINKIAREFNPQLMDPIRVSVHKETLSFSVIDGFHRLMAAIFAGILDIECEILELSDDPDERLEKEVEIFVVQDMNREILKGNQKHKANLIRKTPENIILQRCLDKYKSDFKVKDDKYGTCGLTGFTESLRTTKYPNGEELLDNVFYVIFHSGWHMAKNGLSNRVIISIRNVLLLHWDMLDDTVSAMIDYFSLIDPKIFMSNALATYPNRTEREGFTMYLENQVCEIMKVDPVYYGGHIDIYVRNTHLEKKGA